MEDSFEKLSLEGILSKSRIDVNDTVIDPVVDGDTSESPSSGPRGRKGFLDLPGELRNVIYRLICDRVCPYITRKSHTMGISNAISLSGIDHKKRRLLAIIQVNHQIRHEFLTLLIFGSRGTLIPSPRGAGRITTDVIARFGPPSLSNPAYINGLQIVAGINLKALWCDKPALEGMTSVNKSKCGDCRTGYPMQATLVVQYYIGKHRHLIKGAEHDVGEDHIRASFAFTLPVRYEFAQRTRFLVEATFSDAFETHDAINVEGLFMTSERLMSRYLDVWEVDSYSPSDDHRHEAIFEICRTADGTRPVLRATPQRDLYVRRRPYSPYPQ